MCTRLCAEFTVQLKILIHACPWSRERRPKYAELGSRETVILSSVFLCPGWTLVKSIKFPGPSISPFFRWEGHGARRRMCTLQAPFPHSCVLVPLRTFRAALCPSRQVCPRSSSPLDPRPPSFLFAIKCCFFLLPVTFFHNMLLSLLFPLALSLSPSLCSPPLPFLHLPCM